LTTRRILIIEDDPAMLRGLKDTFTSQGWEVLTAPDGQTGLDASLSSDPDLILLDLMLPHVNGYEICRAVRERGLEMPILMLRP
jgi:DNA-binding response OmpR family regulator